MKDLVTILERLPDLPFRPFPVKEYHLVYEKAEITFKRMFTTEETVKFEGHPRSYLFYVVGHKVFEPLKAYGSLADPKAIVLSYHLP